MMLGKSNAQFGKKKYSGDNLLLGKIWTKCHVPKLIAKLNIYTTVLLCSFLIILYEASTVKRGSNDIKLNFFGLQRFYLKYSTNFIYLLNQFRVCLKFRQHFEVD